MSPLLFRQLFDPQSSTYTYLLADASARVAVLIDPVFEQAQRDGALIDELGLKLACTLETHVHADHVTGAWLLRERFGSAIAISAASGAKGADRYLAPGDRVSFGARWLEALATPGHTNGCTSYVLDDRAMVFTGDALLIRGCGRTDFQQGSAATLFRSVRGTLFALPDACVVYPAHDYRGVMSSSVGEEKRHNPRLAEHVGEGDFVGYMSHLGLPHPKQIDIAVPANLECGKPDVTAPRPGTPAWAPLTLTFAGIWELQPQWLEEHADEVQVVDVREADEFRGGLGRIRGARLLPLGRLAAEADTLSRDRPVVTVCRSGARSAQATVILKKAGFENVANLAGGMLRWREQRLPVEDAPAD